ncbi:interleukin-22 receptor subunit alpha-2 [Peromyscus californicus insignis]|uniref:interleukin-22 receptor subunit alpha-2 n=1 Tax=Peromyscus californicus insignis TaxID=564181 RepID=UPI0022A72A1B|nr:interleukin-22 receptor subunit alpha-2 [Peromyscus californicus insignis]
MFISNSRSLVPSLRVTPQGPLMQKLHENLLPLTTIVITVMSNAVLLATLETWTVHGSLKPQKVQFQSRNFHNVLRWQPGSSLTANGSVYFVQYKMYGQRQWKNKTDCWGTTALSCDLTNETLDLYEPYYGRVKTAWAGRYSAWSRTPRFTPWWETKLDPPVMTAIQGNASLLVLLRTPELPYRNQHGKNTSMENYYDLVYRVFITNNSLAKEQKAYEGTQRTVRIEGLTPHSSYCIAAEIYQPMLDRKSPRSERRCVKIP